MWNIKLLNKEITDNCNKIKKQYEEIQLAYANYKMNRVLFLYYLGLHRHSQL